MFYWNYFGTRVYEKTGLSKTGSLIDFLQEIVSLISVSPYINAVSIYLWLMWIPALAWVCNYPVNFLGKVSQDFSIVLFMKCLISWVTVSPTAVSMLEKPECFNHPHFEDDDSSWLFRFRNDFSCNDSMFSIHVAIGFVPVVILIYFIRFSGYVNLVGRILSLSMLIVGISLSLVSVVLTRYQYTADVHIGICICLIYMLTQQQAYSLLFERDRADVESAFTLLEQKVIPSLTDCLARLNTYKAATRQAKALQISPEEVHEISMLFKSVGDSLHAAKNIPHLWEIVSPKASDDKKEQ